MVNEKRQRWKYVFADYVMTNVAWFCYNLMRYHLGGVRGFGSLGDFLNSNMILLGQFLLPLLMMAVHCLSGYYNEVFRKSRLSELITTAKSSFVNMLVALFAALMNDMMTDNRTYNYESLLVLVGLLFAMTYAARLCITARTSHAIKSRKLSFKTIVVGDGAEGYAFVEKLNRMKLSLGYEVVGFAHIPGENGVKSKDLPVYELEQLPSVCAQYDVREIIVVPSKHDVMITKVLNHLFTLGLPIKVSPERFNMMARTRLSDLNGDPLVDVSSANIGEASRNIKRLLDVVSSALALLLLSPVYALIAILVKSGSKGPVFYRQERLGRHKKPFMIVKFRTMCKDAEENGKPQLASDDDPRITPFGRFMRRYRIDELPQFWNVLKGDMALVGPRPERAFYARQIMEREPAYSLIYQIRPGITSLGQVKFGYAKNVDEMLERLRYDLLYLNNMSLINDLKIIVYTFKIVFTGRGL